jgi:hypothetical protein
MVKLGDIVDGLLMFIIGVTTTSHLLLWHGQLRLPEGTGNQLPKVLLEHLSWLHWVLQLFSGPKKTPC